MHNGQATHTTHISYVSSSIEEEHRSWQEAVEHLYRHHFNEMCRMAQRLLDTSHASEEVVQEAFVRFATLRTRPIAGSELAYLRSIVMNEARSTLRRRVVATRYRFTTFVVGSFDETGDAALQRTTAQSLKKQISELPLRQRQVLTLRHLEGMTERETANTLAISEGSVKTHTSRAMTAMRNKVGAAA